MQAKQDRALSCPDWNSRYCAVWVLRSIYSGPARALCIVSVARILAVNRVTGTAWRPGGEGGGNGYFCTLGSGEHRVDLCAELVAGYRCPGARDARLRLDYLRATYGSRMAGILGVDAPAEKGPRSGRISPGFCTCVSEFHYSGEASRKARSRENKPRLVSVLNGRSVQSVSEFLSARGFALDKPAGAKIPSLLVFTRTPDAQSGFSR